MEILLKVEFCHSGFNELTSDGCNLVKDIMTIRPNYLRIKNLYFPL